MLSLFVFLIIYKNSFVFKITLSITETILFNLGNDEKSLSVVLSVSLTFFDLQNFFSVAPDAETISVLSRIAEVTLLFFSLFGQDVTVISVLTLNLTCAGEGETLLRSGISFHFWHGRKQLIR